jgi:hypothetical protein
MDAVGGDERHGCFLKDRGRGPARCRVAAGDRKFHAVLSDELVGSEYRFLGLGLVVIRDQLYFLTQRASTCIDLFARDLGRDFRRNAVGGSRTGEGCLESDLDFGLCRHRHKHAQPRQQCCGPEAS